MGTMEALQQQEIEFPLVGREEVTEAFLQELEYIKSGQIKDGAQRQVIILKGESGVGKTRMLDSLVVRAITHGIK